MPDETKCKNIPARTIKGVARKGVRDKGHGHEKEGARVTTIRIVMKHGAKKLV